MAALCVMAIVIGSVISTVFALRAIFQRKTRLAKTKSSYSDVGELGAARRDCLGHRNGASGVIIPMVAVIVRAIVSTMSSENGGDKEKEQVKFEDHPLPFYTLAHFLGDFKAPLHYSHGRMAKSCVRWTESLLGILSCKLLRLLSSIHCTTSPRLWNVVQPQDVAVANFASSLHQLPPIDTGSKRFETKLERVLQNHNSSDFTLAADISGCCPTH
ncbi:hypothetical protein MIND_00687400 [Mycena indigotica]|uniref:Uncharacterized protein n=1 Tax=Mycena indigotica TaxID=2126181 RepID=A0A8H6SM90_9AGAR|nr:uncharacterized protein MIND_00687400 [Mycena indigotica]KAF7301226.1 hypothetical protein MIND_00687400 [Mycena indigotica]